MILRISDSIARRLVLASALLVGAWLSFYAVRAAIARYGAEGNSVDRLQLAVRLEPTNATYWYLLGRYHQYDFEHQNSQLAEACYKKAIELNPVYADAWLELATVYELDGNYGEARTAYVRAKKSDPISADVFWRYGNFLLRQGDRASAFIEMRRAIEADPQRAAEAFSRAYRSDPNIEEILQQLLPASPRVYDEVVAQAVREKQVAVAETVWKELLALHPQLTMKNYSWDLVGALLQDRNYTAARRVWDEGVGTMNLPPLFQTPGSVVWDPSFESDVNGALFSWTFPSIAQGVSIKLDKAEKHSGSQSLRLTFDGKHNPNLEAACTLAVVEPGTTYRFSGWIKTSDLTTTQGLGFRIHAYGDFEGPLLNTKQIYGNNPFTLIDQSWTPGSGVHLAKICVTREPSDNPDVRISGTAWVDDVNLVPQPAESPKP